MKLDYNWLKDYIKCDLSVNQIAEIMTSVGIEVDGVEETEVIEGGLKNVVVAKVLTCDIHPDSDHLHITTVDDGSGTPLQVVCGAPRDDLRRGRVGNRREPRRHQGPSGRRPRGYAG